jgi:RHS repeat-associated protein
MIDYSAAGDVATVGTEETLYYVHDALGSVIGLTDAGGDLVERYVYDPYGRTAIERPTGTGGWTLTDGAGEPWQTSAYDNPFMWTGQRYDPGVELYAFLYRTYSPQLGRWLQRDPLGYVDGMNLYEYVAGGPVRYTDPLGDSLTDWLAQRFLDLTGGSGYTTADCVGDCISKLKGAIGAVLDFLAGGAWLGPMIPPDRSGHKTAPRWGSRGRWQPRPYKGKLLGGQAPTSSNWSKMYDAFGKNKPKLAKLLGRNGFKLIGRLAAGGIIMDRAYNALIEMECWSHCSTRPDSQRGQRYDPELHWNEVEQLLRGLLPTKSCSGS